MDPVVTFFILIPIGLAIGILAALLGLGGGILMVPVLFFGIFQLTGFAIETTMAYATTISSTVIIFTGLSGTVAYGTQKRIDYLVGLVCAIFSVGGALLGKNLQPIIGNDALTIIFAVLLIATAFRMGFKAITTFRTKETDKGKVILNHPVEEKDDNQSIENPEAIKDTPPPSKNHFITRLTLERKVEDKCGETWEYKARLFLTPLAFFGGFAAGIAGIGGGIIMVPILHIFIGLPMHLAIATSAFEIIFSTLGAVISAAINPNLTMQGIWWPFVVGLAIGIIAGTQIGAQIAKKTKAAPLKIIFAIVLVAASIWTMIKVFILP